MATRDRRTALITGGAGFIGSNLAERLLATPGVHVRILDNLARHGVAHNLAWLRTLPGGDKIDFVHADIRDRSQVEDAVQDATEIYHLAAQVAVTTSIDAPREDLEVNVLGTFNVLEAARRSGRKPFLLFTSTNKVYGALANVPVQVQDRAYRAQDAGFRGVDETAPLDFHSPYGCSKGAADQYVHDYARIYDLPTVVFRMSCIAGPRQFGSEDQGWVAHFLYATLERQPLTIYGDGFQVRDVLHVHDLVDAICAARREVDHTAGQVYNIGGGPERAVSLAVMLDAIEEQTGVAPILRRGMVRPGDQPLYVSNTERFTAHTGWAAQRSCQEILASIHQFWKDNNELLASHREALLAGAKG